MNRMLPSRMTAVARAIEPEEAALGHQALVRGGLSGRIVIDFTSTDRP